MTLTQQKSVSHLPDCQAVALLHIRTEEQDSFSCPLKLSTPQFYLLYLATCLLLEGLDIHPSPDWYKGEEEYEGNSFSLLREHPKLSPKHETRKQVQNAISMGPQAITPGKTCAGRKRGNLWTRKVVPSTSSRVISMETEDHVGADHGSHACLSSWSDTHKEFNKCPSVEKRM